MSVCLHRWLILLSQDVNLFTQCLSNHLRTILHIHTSAFPTTSDSEIISSDSEWVYRKLQQTLECSICIFNSVTSQSPDFVMVT